MTTIAIRFRTEDTAEVLQSFQAALEAGGHAGERAVGSSQCACAQGLKREVLAATSASLRCRLADPGTDTALLFEPVERRIRSADRQPAPRPFLDVTADGRAVRIIAKPDDRDQDELFEFPEHWNHRGG